MDDASPVSVPPPAGWLRRNAWWVAVGCVAMSVLILGACTGGLVTLVLGFVKSTDVYSGAVSAAQQNPEVKSRLGEPIKPGFLVSGQVKEVNNSGTAVLEIPISGPKGSATLHVAAEKQDGRWRYSKLQLEPDDGSSSSIDLFPLPADPSP